MEELSEMKTKKKPIRQFVTLNDWDLDVMKKVVTAWLDLNIALQTLSRKKTDNEMLQQIAEESITHSIDGKRNVEKVQNPETLNSLIQKIPMKDQMTISAICAFFSGSTADGRMLEFDKEISIFKAKENE